MQFVFIILQRTKILYMAPVYVYVHGSFMCEIVKSFLKVPGFFYQQTKNADAVHFTEGDVHS